MTDILLLWDTPLLFEKLFIEYNLKCQRTSSSAICTPFLPPCKCVLIPTGFANPMYTKILEGIEKNKRVFEKFVKKGGILVVFGPMVNEYYYEWLPMRLKYIQKHGSNLIQKVVEHDAQSLVPDISVPVESDGYFSETDSNVLFNNNDGKPIMVASEFGEGMVIATTIHEFPSSNFLSWVVNRAKMTKI
ncbi:MAG: hypothetical protein JXA38_06840 [Methanosarcinaceae archaeon]|nr:hypothetical protein [Methanosarcinaceae archaeon]